MLFFVFCAAVLLIMLYFAALFTVKTMAMMEKEDVEGVFLTFAGVIIFVIMIFVIHGLVT